MQSGGEEEKEFPSSTRTALMKGDEMVSPLLKRRRGRSARIPALKKGDRWFHHTVKRRKKCTIISHIKKKKDVRIALF